MHRKISTAARPKPRTPVFAGHANEPRYYFFRVRCTKPVSGSSKRKDRDMINFPAGLRKHLKFSPHFRIGLKTQIALLGIIGVLFMGAICLVGLNYVAGAQLESDQSVKLRRAVGELSRGGSDSE